MKTEFLRLLALLSILWLLGLLTVPVMAAEADRKQFQSILTAIEAGESGLTEQIAQLDGYPLQGYLEYRLLRRDIRRASAEQIESFMQKWADSYLSDALRNDFLYELARRKDWAGFERIYDPKRDTAIALQCHYLEAQLRQQSMAADWEDKARSLWLSGTSRPKACDPVFDYLYENGLISLDHRRQRIAMAYERGNDRLARFLARGQPEVVQVHMRHWSAARKDAKAFLQAELKDNTPDQANPWRNDVRVQAFRWLARENVSDAVVLAHQIPDSWQLSAQQLAAIWREIGLRAAWRHYPEAYAWLSRVPTSESDEAVRVWRVRAALRIQDWAAVLEALDGLTEQEQSEAEWQYWRARALMETGRRDDATRIFRELAQSPTYYGMLAADRIGAPYQLSHPGPRYNQSQRQALARQMALRMAREFWELGMLHEARLQWNFALNRMDRTQLEIAAELADQWGWHDRAAVTVGRIKRAGGEERLDLGYPLPWREQVMRLAKAEQVDPSWVYGVIRRESLFMHDVSSSAGAVGLMQLMPATAEWIGGRRNLIYQRDRLTDVDTNLALGTAYLNYLTDRFGGHKVLATAAYNAGQGRVRQWLPTECMPADIWIDTVPFTETREYARAVLNAAAIFSWRMDNEPHPISSWMPPVPPRER